MGLFRLVPQKLVTLPGIGLSAYNYEVPACHARTMANCARPSMLINKRRFSENTSSILSGEGLDEGNEENRCQCFIEPECLIRPHLSF